MSNRTFQGDVAQDGLLKHLADTERALRNELRKLDKNAECEVLAAADLGVPYDVVRLAGGYATGCFVQWHCSVPIVPIDVTMNIDTSSIFWVSNSAIEKFTENNLLSVRRKITEKTNYIWNVNDSNHFITLVQDENSGDLAIIIHSNEKEFKNQYHGLCPTADNWFASDVIESSDGRMRLLIGRAAEIFISMAHMLEPYNIVRHCFMLHELLGSSVDVKKELHHQHYYMPSNSSAALGCYVVSPGVAVPVFSQLGAPILMYAGSPGGPNSVRVGGEVKCIIPHGYGMGMTEPLRLEVMPSEIKFQGTTYPRRSGISLLGHPSVIGRNFSSDGEFVKALAMPCPGTVLGKFRQLRSLTRFGFRVHSDILI